MLVLPAPVTAATLHVPADYPTIQSCIDAAVSGQDECVVAPGTYHETINFLNKAIAVRSSDGALVTTIDATGLSGSVVTCASGEGLFAVINGLTITGGLGTILFPGSVEFAGGGMYNLNSNPTVSNCIFTLNTASHGGGMYNVNSNPTLTNCTFNENASNYRGGGVAARGESRLTGMV